VDELVGLIGLIERILYLMAKDCPEYFKRGDPLSGVAYYGIVYAIEIKLRKQRVGSIAAFDVMWKYLSKSCTCQQY
jgi:hypothetical protein